MKSRYLGAWAGLGALVLVGCAQMPARAPGAAISGYTFGYRVTGPVKASVVSGADKTWVALPAGVTLQQAEGDGANVPVHRNGNYWVLPKLATDWDLYTSAGPVSAQAPTTVGVLLAASQQHRHSAPVWVHRTRTVEVPFVGGSGVLEEPVPSDLVKLATTLSHAHRVMSVSVTGQTSGVGPVGTQATVGAARSAAVTGWLAAHGVGIARDLGWTQGSGLPQATVVAEFETRKPTASPKPVIARAVSGIVTAPDADAGLVAGPPLAHEPASHVPPFPAKASASLAPAPFTLPHHAVIHAVAASVKPVTEAKAAPAASAKPETVATTKETKASVATKIVSRTTKKVSTVVAAKSGVAPSARKILAISTPPAAAHPAAAKHVARAPHEEVLQLRAGQLLSQQLKGFLKKQGWALVWAGHVDYDLKYPGSYRAATLDGVLKHVAGDYHLRIRIYHGNRTVVVEPREAV